MTKAIDLGLKTALVFYSRGAVYMKINKSNEATEDFKVAARLGSKEAMEYLKSKGVAW